MKQFRLLSLSVAMTATFMSAHGQNIVNGGQFKDRILPMQGSVTLETLRKDNPEASIWGAPGVQNRFTDNGIEDPGMNIWGGNVIKGEDGLYHQFVAGWDGLKRPFSYWSNSDIYHFTSSTPYGPFINPVKIGRGHNPEIFRAKDGSYVVYALIGNSSCWRHTSKTLNGPWVFEEMPFDLRDRALSTGSTTTYSNWTFAQRADGSQYCMDRGGAVWISEDGLGEFHQVYGTSCYPGGGGRTFEDPVIWKDEVQYHMIVNDWNARKAYYSRSADGFHWIAEDGLAYDIEISVHPDGAKEEWYKYERPRVYQDKYGRAIQLNMAVVDTIKAQDLAGDNHSSKNIAMPLNPGLRLFILNDTPISTTTSEIKLKVMAEDGFNPSTDLDLESLRFGSHSIVAKGGGAVVERYSADNDGNLILSFNGKDTGIGSAEFAPKLLGKYSEGYVMNLESGKELHPSFCYGYARLPYHNYTPAYLSPILPEIGEESMVTSVNLTNYGISASDSNIKVRVLTKDGKILAYGLTDKAIVPYSNHNVKLTPVERIPAGQQELVVEVDGDQNNTDRHTLLLTSVNAAQAKLSTAFNEASLLYGNESYANGRDAMKRALDEAKNHLSSYYEPELTRALEALQSAMSIFVAANPGVANVSCRNYYLKAAGITSGNNYVYGDDDGTLARKNTYDDSSVFTLIIDGDNDRTYLYNPKSKTFVVAKAGNGKSFWTASETDAYILAKVENSVTTTDAYTIKGDPTSTNTYNYLNAYGGANHTELSSYTVGDKNSQWQLIPSENQKYDFDVTKITTGLDDFLSTARNINGAKIKPVETGIDGIVDNDHPENEEMYDISGIRLNNNRQFGGTKRIVILNGKKIIKK